MANIQYKTSLSLICRHISCRRTISASVVDEHNSVRQRPKNKSQSTEQLDVSRSTWSSPTNYADDLLLFVHSSSDHFTEVNIFFDRLPFRLKYFNRISFADRYLLQFYMNFVGSYNRHCSFFHFAPHLLKTLELFNYAFNVFVSIVSGKHGRRELFDMLLCRTMSNQTPRSQGTLKTPGTSSPKTYTLLRFQLKQNRDNSTMLLNNPPRVPLIPVTHSSTSNGSRNGQRPNHYHFA